MDGFPWFIAGDGEGLELDNELLELAADPVDEGGDELDDDTLVALALENGGPEGDTAGDGEILGLADNDGLEALDDDELLELAMQGIAE